MDRWRRFAVQKWGLPQRIVQTNAWQNQTRALAAFHTLGSNATPAAKLIIPLLRDPNTAFQAVVALMLIRPEQEHEILSLTNVANIRQASRTGTTPDMLLSGALLALGSFGSKASNAIPFLIGSLSSTNDGVQAAAAVALARIGAPAEQVVPPIIASLPNSDPALSRKAITSLNGFYVSETLGKIWALEQFGPKAGEALPALARLESYQIANFKEAAKRAAARIRQQPPGDY